MKVKKLIESYSVLIYVILAFVISWGLIGIIAGPVNIPINPETSKDMLPLLYVSMLFGPSLAGIVLIWYLEKKSGLRRLLAKMLKWRFNMWWYIISLLTIPVLASLILYILSYLKSEIYIGIQL